MLSSPKLLNLVITTLIVFLAKLNGHFSATLNLYAQCGGIGYTGSTECPSGSYCAKTSEWWSACKPGNRPISTAKPPPKPSTSKSSSDSQIPSSSSSSKPKPSELVQLWGQGGGLSYTGATQCVTGASCLRQSDWYSQCQPTNNNNDDIKPTSQPNDDSIVTDASASSSSSAAVVIGPNDLVAGYYWWTWSQNAKPPSGLNMGVCFR